METSCRRLAGLSTSSNVFPRIFRPPVSQYSRSTLRCHPLTRLYISLILNVKCFIYWLKPSWLLWCYEIRYHPLRKFGWGGSTPIGPASSSVGTAGRGGVTESGPDGATAESGGRGARGRSDSRRIRDMKTLLKFTPIHIRYVTHNSKVNENITTYLSQFHIFYAHSQKKRRMFLRK